MLYRKLSSIIAVVMCVYVGAVQPSYAHNRGNLVDHYYYFELVGQSDVVDDGMQDVQWSRSNTTSVAQTVQATYKVTNGFGWALGTDWLGLKGYDENETQITETIVISPWTGVSVITKKKWQYSHYNGYTVNVYWCFEHNEYEFDIVFQGTRDWKDTWTDVWFVEHPIDQPVSTDPEL